MHSLSILVPIYNVETYLRACLESIRAQTISDFEVLCINDGSSDGSAGIIDDFVASDARFVRIDKENGGYGSAMNCGLANAKGDYVGIVEPDDFIEPDMFETLLSHTTVGNDDQADVVKGLFWEYSDGEDGSAGTDADPRLKDNMPSSVCWFTAKENPSLLCNHPSVWSAIYRREHLERNNVRFIEAPSGGWVDNPFVYEALVPARKIVWIPQALYHYRVTNENASSARPDYHLVFDRMRDIRTYLHARKTPTAIWDAFYRHEFNYLNMLRGQDCDLHSEEIRPLVMEMLADMDQAVMQWGRFYTDWNRDLFASFIPIRPLNVMEKVRMKLYLRPYES